MMQKQRMEDARNLLNELEAGDAQIIVTGKNSIFVKGSAPAKCRESLRILKPEILNVLSPACSKCSLRLELIFDNTLWFCPFGCESRQINEKPVMVASSQTQPSHNRHTTVTANKATVNNSLQTQK